LLNSPVGSINFINSLGSRTTQAIHHGIKVQAGPVLRFSGPRARLKPRALNIDITTILINICIEIYS
jgi:hypothetical protein